MDRSEAQGQYVTISLSAAFDYVNQPKQAVQKMCVDGHDGRLPQS